MERPLHNLEQVASKTKQSRAAGLAVVIAIHVGVVAALIVGLSQGALLKQMQDIKASVEADKTPPKAPPPPPPDLVKPPPPTAIVPEFSVEQAAAPTITTVVKQPPAPPKAVVVAPTKLEPIRSTFTLPPYPTISQRLGEQGTTTLKIKIGTDGHVTDAEVQKSSGSPRLDQAAVEWVKSHYRYKPPTIDNKPTEAETLLNVVWNLKDAQ